MFFTSDISTRSFKRKAQNSPSFEATSPSYIHTQKNMQEKRRWWFRAFHQEPSHLFPPFVLNVEEEFLLKHKNLLYSQSLYIITVAKWYKIKYILSILSSIQHLYMCVFQHSRKTLKETENKSMGHHSVQLWVFKNSLLAGLFCVTDSTKTTC